MYFEARNIKLLTLGLSFSIGLAGCGGTSTDSDEDAHKAALINTTKHINKTASDYGIEAVCDELTSSVLNKGLAGRWFIASPLNTNNRKGFILQDNCLSVDYAEGGSSYIWGNGVNSDLYLFPNENYIYLSPVVLFSATDTEIFFGSSHNHSLVINLTDSEVEHYIDEAVILSSSYRYTLQGDKLTIGEHAVYTREIE